MLNSGGDDLVGKSLQHQFNEEQCNYAVAKLPKTARVQLVSAAAVYKICSRYWSSEQWFNCFNSFVT